MIGIIIGIILHVHLMNYRSFIIYLKMKRVNMQRVETVEFIVTIPPPKPKVDEPVTAFEKWFSFLLILGTIIYCIVQHTPEYCHGRMDMPWYYEFDTADDMRSKVCQYLEIPPDIMPKLEIWRRQLILDAWLLDRDYTSALWRNATNMKELLREEYHPVDWRYLIHLHRPISQSDFILNHLGYASHWFEAPVCND